VKRILCLILAALSGACGFIPERVSFDDARVQKLLQATSRVNRAAMGFTPVDRSADLRLESRPRAGYDAMLHVNGRTSRTIAFRRVGDSYEWIGEQETFTGPREYETPDGRFHEAIVITFETVHLSGAPLNRIFVRYRGPDARLTELDASGALSLEAVMGNLKAWGY
jgi:hypothetical protein